MQRPQILLVFDLQYEECVQMLKGIANYERSHGSWAAFLDDEMKAETNYQWLASKKWDGVISRHTTRALVEACAELQLPLVDLNDVPPFPGVPKIRPDNTTVGHLGAEHLIERGFTNLAFCGFRADGWSCERRDGFIEAAKLAGQSVHLLDVDYPGDLNPFWDEAQLSELTTWLQRLPKPVGVMACNDLRAQQVINAAHQVNLLVPEEIAVLGANNDLMRCELVYPYLSSIATNPTRSGYLAAETLDRLLKGLQPDSYDVRVDPLEVVARQSTDLFAIKDRNMAAALAYIREHACEGISVDDVVRHAAASRSLLEKRFRETLGLSPHAVIRKMQVTKIKQLLQETDYPLKKIADLAGFEHVEYMCVLFKRLVGKSPGDFRQQFHADAAGR